MSLLRGNLMRIWLKLEMKNRFCISISLSPEYNVLNNVMLPGFKLGKYSKEELEHRAMGHLKH
jgi:ABC-type polar amino acid transport system ATPase subunit